VAGWQSSVSSPTVWAGGKNNVTLYHGNYLNYLTDPGVPLRTGTRPTRFQEVSTAIEALIDTNTSINVGLLVFDTDRSNPRRAGLDRVDGGAVIFPMEDINIGRTAFMDTINALADPDTWTPLSESYHEALRYFGGLPVGYGATSVPLSVAGVQDGSGNYVSPITNECQKNSIIVLTDGEATNDSLNAAELGLLPGFTGIACASGELDDEAGEFAAALDSSDCLDDLADWAFTQDVLADDGSVVSAGRQFITTHTVGFANLALANPDGLIVRTAAAGDGIFVPADNADSLRSAISQIFAKVLGVNTSFSSPAVSVNAFNRSTHLSDLYFTLFKPGDSQSWDGNLKKYKLAFKTDPADAAKKIPFIADATGAEAVNDTTGFFDDGAVSFWTDTAVLDAKGDPVGPDGAEVAAGGAVSALTVGRKVYTFTGAYSDTDGVFVPTTATLSASGNALDKTNASLTETLLGTTGFVEKIATVPYRETLLDWAKGIDVFDRNDNGSVSDIIGVMGDPLHAQPALVQYGEKTVGGVLVPDLVAYVATNDGYLHAFETANGKELFSFVPQELLTNLTVGMEDSGSKKMYGLDGDVVAWVEDVGGDGSITVGTDRVYLYFGMRRGGKNIYALDVTDPTDPKLKWVIKGGFGDFTELSDTWSSINVEKIMDGTTPKTVLVFGGGYDENQDAATARTVDTVGRAIFIVDANTGERLWLGAATGDTSISDMKYSIPARIKPLDISGDGFVDRLYAVDMGGQIFRFDIDNTNGASLASSITGDRIADLAGSADVDARRFYYPPDVALVDDPAGKYHALVIGSGFRAHPLDTVIRDRIYMLKDKNTGRISTGYTTLTEADLKDVTDNLAGGESGTGTTGDAARDVEVGLIAAAEGWYIDLDDGTVAGGWIGEKALAEPLIIEGRAIITTYIPDFTATVGSCEPKAGDGKVYFLDIIDATPAFPAGVDKRPQRHIELKRGGIPPSPNVIITTDKVPTLCVGTECQQADFGLGARKTFWYEVEN